MRKSASFGARCYYGRGAIFDSCGCCCFLPTESSSSSKSKSLANDEQVARFTEYEPYLFKSIRNCSRVDDEMYKQSIEQPVKQRLTEGGASGAFFLFSQCERFMVKSCSKEEMMVLLENAEDYASYLSRNRDSFIARVS